MKKVLFATAALVATAGVASAYEIDIGFNEGYFGSTGTLLTASATFADDPGFLPADMITDQAAATGLGETGAYDLMRDTAGLTFGPEIETIEPGAGVDLLTADLDGLPVPDLTDGAASQTLAFEAWNANGGTATKASLADAGTAVAPIIGSAPMGSATGLPVFSPT